MAAIEARGGRAMAYECDVTLAADVRSMIVSVEREFGRLKHHYGLAILRVRRIERVRLHADLVMLGPLSLALTQARQLSLAM